MFVFGFGLRWPLQQGQRRVRSFFQWGCTSHTFIQEDQAINGANRSIKNCFEIAICVCPKIFAAKTAIM